MSIEQPEIKPSISPDQLPSLDETAEVPLRNRDDGPEKFRRLQESYERDETATVPAERQDDRHNRGFRKLGHAGVLALVGTVAAGGIWVGSKAIGGEKTEPKAEPSASAPAKTGEVVTTADTPSELVGKVNTASIETVNIKPTQEIINDALKPVTVDAYPTPEDAFKRLSEVHRVYELSASVNTNSNSEFPELEDSINTRDKILDNLYGSSRDNLKLEEEDNLRRMIAAELWFLNDSAAATSDKATWSRETVANSITKNDENTFNVEGRTTVYTNIPEVDPYFDTRTVIKGIDESRAGLPVNIQLSNDGKVWHWDSFIVVK